MFSIKITIRKYNREFWKPEYITKNKQLTKKVPSKPVNYISQPNYSIIYTILLFLILSAAAARLLVSVHMSLQRIGHVEWPVSAVVTLSIFAETEE